MAVSDLSDSSRFSITCEGSRVGFGKGLCATIFMLAFSASSAMAQNCSTISLPSQPLPNGVPTAQFTNVVPGFATGLAAANAIAATINATNTAFLTQSTAFVAAPGDPKPNSEGGGVWVRGVGGDLTVKSASTVDASVTVKNTNGSPFGSVSGSGNCSSTFRQDFAGFQLGQDVARLNVGGWNLHLGTTAGYVETKGHVVGGNISGGAFDSATQAPFVGTYVVATNGGFFIDGLLRWDYYETTLDSPTINVFSQKLDAHGLSAAGSFGYHWNVPNSRWFIEPSAGVVWSHVSVDPFNTSNPVTGQQGFFDGNFQGTTQISDITSTIGRVGIRFGTTLESGNVVWQPFAAVSVWHEFGDAVQSRYENCNGCLKYQPNAPNLNPTFPASLTALISGQNIGTFGQYSVGTTAQLLNYPGWLGFVRVDYRDGERMHGLSGTGGIRYQFTPDAAQLSDMPVKAKATVAGPYNWTGLYLGGFGGAGYGTSHMDFPALGFAAGPQNSGALLGGQIGYNYQIGSWVFGIEGDGGWTNTSGTNQCSPLSSAFDHVTRTPLFQMDCHVAADWIATVTGRLGYASGRTLYYAKAGAAWSPLTFSATCNLGPENNSTHTDGAQHCTNPANAISDGFSVSSTRMGWTVGFGIEFGLTPNWSAKGEIDFIDFGNRTLTASDGTVINAGMHATEAKIGVNYRFNP